MLKSKVKKGKKNLSSTFISGWYAVLQSALLAKGKLLSVKRFNLSLVFWRTKQGEVYCLLDRCPHRGAKLSIGKIKNNCIECPYHGFQFNKTGVCEYAPEFNKAIPGLKVQTFMVKEAMGMIWLFYGNETPPAFEYNTLHQLHDSFSGKYCETSRVWQSHITYCIENQLDYTHLPLVHKSTIGRGFKYPEVPQFDFSSECIAISFEERKNISEYFFPNTWVLNVSEKMKIVVYFSPIDETRTQLYLRAYNPILKFKLGGIFLAPIFNKLNMTILRQDQRVVKSQGIKPSYLASNDVLMKNDKAIRYFRACWLKKLKSMYNKN